MKEIKAYVRREKIEEVICGLKEAGIPGLTVISVNALGRAAVPEEKRFSIEYSEEYSTIKKIEIVCRDEDVMRYVDVIREKAYTGHKGDGMIFVSTVDFCLKIRSGECGKDALLPG